MSKGNNELNSPAAKALRAAGYKPLPRWWVKVGEDLDMIEFIVSKHADEVHRIRAEANSKRFSELTKEEQIERAWASIRKE